MKTRTLSAFASTLAAVTLLVGCSGDSDTEKAPKTGADGLPEIPELKDSEGVRKDLSEATCERDASGKWSGGGTITNTSEKERAFVVSFTVSTTDGSKVLGRAVKTVDLAAGESKEISAKEFYSSTEPALQCVIAATRGAKS